MVCGLDLVVCRISSDGFVVSSKVLKNQGLKSLLRTFFPTKLMKQITIGLPTQKCWVRSGDRGRGKGEDLKPFPFPLSPFPFPLSPLPFALSPLPFPLSPFPFTPPSELGKLLFCEIIRKTLRPGYFSITM